tara:strand:- start:4742 stop:5416 length:675 start_codon:yes stop_codon:yes gene_type:complete
MSDLLGLSELELTTTSLSEFIVGFVLTIIFSLLIKKIYSTYSNSVSNKSIVANIFPLFSVAIFLIVVTIKSSIVLSLGLVGALSIIRFRTAIKEAEQIVYFLILTAISISNAAGSYLFPILLVIFIFIYNYYRSKQKSGTITSTNDHLVITTQIIENTIIEELIYLLNEAGVNVEIQSINRKEDNIVIVLKLSDFSIKALTIVETFLKQKGITKKEIQFFSSSE